MRPATQTDPFVKLFGFLLLGVILMQADTQAMAESLAQTDLGLLGTAFGLGLLCMAVKAVRWNRMLRWQGEAYPYPKAFEIYLAGFYIGIATPGRLGELARALYVKRDFKTSAGLALSSAFLDRLLDLYTLLAIGLIASFRFEILGPVSPVFALPVTGMVVLPFFLFSRRARKWIIRKLLGPTVRRRVGPLLADGTEDFFAGLEKMISPRFVVWWVLTWLAYFCFFQAGFLLAQALGIEIGFVDAALVFGLANLFSLVPVTIAGVGTRDVIFVFTFSALALAEAHALAFSALVLLNFYLLPGFLGLLAFLRNRLSPALM